MGMIEDKDIELHIDRETLLQEYIPKADYENRLKADVVAMLIELQLEIEELKYGQPIRDYVVDECSKIIQQKIDKLKEKKGGENR